MMKFLSDPYSLTFWLVWAVFLVWQNYAFTFVSRARNSASLKRHSIAALQSNGVWFVQTIFVFTAFKSIVEGRYGIGMTIFAILYYTLFTMAGSIYAHHRALKKEHGLSAVGASKKYAQIPVEDWRKANRALKAMASRMGESKYVGWADDVYSCAACGEDVSGLYPEAVSCPSCGLSLVKIERSTY